MRPDGSSLVSGGIRKVKTKKGYVPYVPKKGDWRINYDGKNRATGPGDPSAPVHQTYIKQKKASSGPAKAAPAAPAEADNGGQQALADIMSALQGQSNASMSSEAELLAKATQMVAAQLDPQLKGIAGQEAQTKTRYNSQDKAVQSLYNTLTSQFKGQVGQAGQNYQDSINSSAASYKDLDKGLQTNTNEGLTDTISQLRQLGIEDTGAAATSGLARDSALMRGVAKSSQETTQSSLGMLKSAAEQYMKEMAAGSQSEGVLRKDDLASQLTQYMQGFQAQKAGIEAQRPGAIQDTLQKLQAAQVAAAQAQQQLDMQKAEFMMKAQDMQADNANDANTLAANSADDASDNQFDRLKLATDSATAAANAKSKAAASIRAPANGEDAALYALRNQYGIDQQTSQSLYNIMNSTLTGSKDIATGSNAWQRGGEGDPDGYREFKTPAQKAERVMDDFNTSQYAGNAKYKDALRKAVLAYYGSGW